MATRLRVELLGLLKQGHGLAEGPAIFECPGRRVEPHRLGPLAVFHRTGAERNERARRVVARLAEDRRDVGLLSRRGCRLCWLSIR